MQTVVYKNSTTRAEPTRRCVVCRSERLAAKLVRLSQTGGVVHLAPKSSGRGAHVCARRGCLEQLTARHVSRALRERVEAVDVTSFMEAVHDVAEQRLLGTVGLARRQGSLRVGVEQRSVAGELVIAASDLASRSVSQLGDEALRFLDGTALGRAAGMGWVGAMRIAPGRLADRAAYWLALWYETRSPAGGSAENGPQSTEVV
jgi:predicted RNA-binding protein YlxR (DUF448 family)